MSSCKNRNLSHLDRKSSLHHDPDETALMRPADMLVRTYSLTRREVEILAAVIEFGTVRLTAEFLHLSACTVDSHLDHLRNKSVLRTTAQLVD